MDNSAKYLELSRFWIQRVVVPILVFIGIGGNIVTVIILTRQRMRCTTNIYLTALAVADLIYLFFVIILSFEHYDIKDVRYELYWRFFGINHWFADAASNASIWLTVCFTIERYIAVCHPIRGKVLCTEKRAKRVIAVVAIMCILATATTSFEYELTTSKHCVQKVCQENDVHTNTEFTNTTVKDNKTSTFQENPNLEENTISHGIESVDDWKKAISKLNETKTEDIVEETSPFNILLREIDDESKSIPENCTEVSLPISFNDTGQNCSKGEANCTRRYLTCPTNFVTEEEEDADDCCISKYVIKIEQTQLGRNATYKTVFYWFSSVTFAFLPLILIATFNCFLVNAVRKSQKERKTMTKSQENNSQAQENRMTVILISVVILFLICQTPTACMLIYTSVYTPTDPYHDNVVRGLGNLFNLLVAINASCNFLLYCALSDKYRRTFKALLCDKSRLSRKDTFAISGKFASRISHSTNVNNAFKRNNTVCLSRSVETQSLTSMPRTQSLMSRPIGNRKRVTLVV